MRHSLCDLYPTNDRYLGSGKYSDLVIIRGYEEDVTYYQLLARDPELDTTWKLLVLDPLTAFQCLREGWGPSTINIADALLAHGIPFQTVARAPVPSPRSVPYRAPSNGADPEGQQRGPCDYLQYQDVLRNCCTKFYFLFIT
jgi:hypothetical protein